MDLHLVHIYGFHLVRLSIWEREKEEIRFYQSESGSLENAIFIYYL